ncbi:NAD-dependent epimerase/dehydratase family protein [Aspergillus ruber CBS 135680]|uniref:Nucleoside-diphosphate-sugar epimerase n=1 Tax=Aspergillus ruber (strain CBS 135680) TaxID=1388766 RepID=A0A017S6V9_ASPRC|nr:nucleoside-diphosphate-sugar epimerase [Aspergillus ruber CBS 135680]EYE91905.1 nucleoside-diphosphate-sugar epimerase [Aspergillus ruber CBS 135680]
MKTVFITGVSGYIGGDLLSVLTVQYPDYNYRALVRSEKSSELIKAQFPAVEIVQSDLDNLETLRNEGAGADIIIPDASDHLDAAQAIVRGALEGHDEEHPVYYLHTSGTGILSFLDTENGVYGERRDKLYNDLEGVQEILSFPDHAFHRNVDKFVLGAGAEQLKVLKTAIVSPTTVYGRGRGVCSQRSRQIYEMSKYTLQTRKIPIIGRGLSIGGNIHVADVTSLFVLLFERAHRGDENNKLWGGEAYYIAANSEHCWGDVARLVGKVAVDEGFIPSAEVQSLDVDTARQLAGFETVSWGLNMRSRAKRAREYLGWEASGPSLQDEIPGIVREEWQRLQE